MSKKTKKAKKAKRPLVIDKRAPTKSEVLLPSGRKITLKRKQAYDKGRFDTEMREQYLELIREGITNKDAAAACGCGTKYFQRRRKQDPLFEADYQDARGDGDDVIRGEIHRRGVAGVPQAVYHDGKVVGTKQIYSDQLLMFLAKSRMDEFKENQIDVSHTHKFAGAGETLIAKMANLMGLPIPDEQTLIEGEIVDAIVVEED